MLLPQQPSQAARSPAKETLVPPLVHVVDDEPSIRKLFLSLAQLGQFEIETYATAEEFLAEGDTSRRGCVVLDLNLPGQNGLDLMRTYAARPDQLPVVFMSGMAKVSEAVSALKLGSVDFVEKPFDLQTMLTAVQRAVGIDQQRRQAAAANHDLQRRFARLTQRETEVMQHIVRGAANKEVAARLGLSPKTVEVHRANVMRKTQANSLAELVRMHLALSS